MNEELPTSDRPNWIVWSTVWLEIILLVGLAAFTCGEIPPDINESHYLTKAKHFWQPDWCDNDLFVGSSDAHWFFFATLGWLTTLFPLGVAAWIMRLVCWAGFAFAWRRLNAKLFSKPFISLATFVGMVLLIRYCNLAGEWIVGGAEGKSFAYIFVILALSYLIENKWCKSGFALAIASLFHILVGGWSVLAFLFVCLVIRPKRTEWALGWKWGVAALLILFANGAFPFLASALGWSSSVLGSPESNEVYVRFRLPHHLYYWDFSPYRITAFIIPLCVGVWLATKLTKDPRVARISLFALFAMFVAVIGILLSVGSDLNQSGSKPGLDFRPYPQVEIGGFPNAILRFYLFRMSDAMLAIALPLILSKLIFTNRPQTANPLFGALCCVLGFLMVVEFGYRHTDIRPPADERSLPKAAEMKGSATEWENEHYKNWKKVCFWVRENTPKDAVFVTPREQQTFVWYSHRAQVVCFKDIPQDGDGILEWRQRIRDLHESRLPALDDVNAWKSMKHRYKFQYLIVPQGGYESKNTEVFEQVYPADPEQRVSYVVLRLK